MTLISGALAMSPVYSYRRGKRREAVPTSAEKLLSVAPNPEWSPFQYRAFCAQQMLLWGGSYSMIARRGGKLGGEPIALWPLPASQMCRKFTDGGQLYYERNTNGKTEQYPAEAVMYVPYTIVDHQGNGLSVISAHAEAIGANQAAEKHSALWFRNGARMPIALSTPAKLSDNGYRRLRESWEEVYGGVDNSHKPAILEEGLKIEALTLKPQDSQLLETRTYNDEQIAMLFGVPPSMIGLTAKSTSWGSGIAEQVLGWQKFTVGQYGTQFEQCAHRQLVGDDTIELRHDYSELLRMDFKSLVEALKTAVQAGIISPNEAREAIDYDAAPGGDALFLDAKNIPLTMAGTLIPGGANDSQVPTV